MQYLRHAWSDFDPVFFYLFVFSSSVTYVKTEKRRLPPPPPSGLNNMLEEDNLISFMLTTEELEIVKSVVAALDPFKVATNFLCSRKFNLASAEDIVRFTASKLEGNVDDLCGRLLATERIQHWYHLSSSFKIQIPRARILITECQEEVT